GLAGGWKLLWPLVRGLARHFEVFLPELRGDRARFAGAGQEAGPMGDLGGYAEDLVVVMDQLGLANPSVFGVSFGGAVALELAVQHPHRLSRLIVHGAEARFHPSLGSAITRRVLERFPLPSDNRF